MPTYNVVVSGILEEYIAKAIKKGLEGPDVPDSIKIKIIEVDDPSEETPPIALAAALHQEQGIERCPAGLGHEGWSDCPAQDWWLDHAEAIIAARLGR